MSPADEGPGSRPRQWPRRLTFWTFLAPVLSPGSACRSAIRQAPAQARLENRPVPAEDTRPYCQARARLPLELLHELIDRVGRTLEQRVPETARWCGRVVKVADGTTQSADDTPANQQACPQPQSQRAGCGFPLMRLVGRFSLARGALLGFATGHYRQSELALAVQWWTLLAPGDGWLADRYFGCSRVLALVLGRKADAVGRWQGSRRADFRWGKRRGPLDRQVVWQRPRQVPAGMSVGPWLALPASPAVAGCGWGALPGRKKACARAG